MATHPTIDLDPHELDRKITRWLEHNEMVRQLALAGLRYDHPDASPGELQRLFHQRMAFFRKDKWKGYGSAKPL